MKKKTTIEVSGNGPLVVNNLKSITESTKSKQNLENKSNALCRCGKSRTKPICDGTHGKINFDDSKSDDRVKRNLKSYIGREIIIHDDRGICSHAGYCTDGLPEVFNMELTPWIDPDAASIEKIIETIEKCPSGALSYTVNEKKYDNYYKKEEILVNEDGPYYVRGNIEFIHDDKPQTQNHYALCRCGSSKNKPYCNGQHWYRKFKDDGLFKDEHECTCSSSDPYDNKVSNIQKMARNGKSENSSMRTEESFPDFKTILFKGVQLNSLPYNEDVKVNMKTVIGKKAKKPLEISIPFYVSHMSFGALSKEAKVSLAKGSTLVDTAMCSGEGGMLPESRKAAKKYIYELGTAPFSHDDEIIKKADAVELKIGQAVKPGVGGHLPAKKITPEIAEMRNTKEGEAFVSPGRFYGMDNINDLKEKVSHIRAITGGVPVGIKITAAHLEKDLDKALLCDPDFITIDCRGGATGSAPKFLKDNVGIPPIFTIRKARNYLDSRESDVTLCITGGFRDSSDIAKGLALGADAIALATASLISIGCIQSKVCHTGLCPVGITTQDKSLRKVFNKEKALTGFENFYNVTKNELKVFARSNGKKDIHDLCLDDLVTISNEVSLNTDIKHV